MRRFIRRHLKLLDPLSLGALVAGALLCQAGFNLPGGILMAAGLVCFFAFTLIGLTALLERCPCFGCPVPRKSASAIAARRSVEGQRRCPNCGTILK